MTPNWHPTIAHFPIALLLTGITSFWIAASLRESSDFRRQLLNFGHWNLRIGFVFSLLAMASGVFARLGVPRDPIAQEAMDMHSDMAGIVVAAMIPFFIVSCLRHRLPRHIMRIFTLGLIIPVIPLAYTTWLGTEAVYRYGLGVQRTEPVPGPGEQHMHRSGGAHQDNGSLSGSGNARYPDRDFESDTGEAVGGERQDTQSD
ncbi:MAG TPA: DUF2231 domain-containing protein [Gammaproteobacteria bacterium]|nr:DUF2231 domain-containing protein [Gammaproteobacteria bacterium]